MNDSNEPKLHSQRYYKENKFSKYLLPFSSESFAFPAAIQECKD
jgi:hypothetical protein